MFPIRDHNPSLRTPYVTWTLIAINVAVWLWSVAVPGAERIVYAGCDGYAMYPACLSNGQSFLSLLSATFLHGGLLHLAGNMLFLWIFGDNLEDEMGALPFLGFYLACGVGSFLAQWAADPWSPIPTVGASGAIAGVMGGYLLLFPRARIDIVLWIVIIFRIFPVPAWIVLAIWFALQLVGGIGTDTSGGGVAYWAHAGGFVLGFLLTLPVLVRRGGTAFWRRTDGHPPHSAATYPIAESSIPRVPRK